MREFVKDGSKVAPLVVGLLGLALVALSFLVDAIGLSGPGFGPKQVMMAWFGMALVLFAAGVATPAYLPQVMERKVARRVLYATWASLWIVGVFAGVEVYSRQANQIWHPEIGNLHMQPYFMTGGVFQTAVAGIDEDEVLVQPVGPEAFGYVEQGNTYAYGFAEPVSSVADRGDFLFQNRVEIANDTDNEDVIRIFVIGASAAYGVGASTDENRWFEVLERDLSQAVGKEVVLVPAAVPGYVSTQERLILELMVLPREPDAIVFLDGFNDVALPVSFGFRPGDPFNQGILYENYYSPLFGLKKWIGEYSHFYRFMFHNSLVRSLDENARNITEDPVKSENYVESVAAVYISNVDSMLDRCADDGIPCLVFLQPSRDITRRNQGSTDLVDPLIAAAYDRVREKGKELGPDAAFHDLTPVFDAPGHEEWYIDTVHFNDEGHQAVAETMFPIVLEAITR